MEGRFRFWDFDHRAYIQTDTIIRLSCSDIKAGGECQYKILFKLTKPKIEKCSPPLLIGSVFHGALETYYRIFLKNGKRIGWSGLEKVFEQGWNKERARGIFTEKKPEEACKLKCKNYLRVYHKERARYLVPKDSRSIETFFRFKVSSEDKHLEISGKSDLLDASNFLQDHKTSSSAWTQEQADKELQGHIYPLAFKANGIPVQGFQFSVVEGVRVKVYNVEYNDSYAKEIVQKAFNIKKDLEEDNLTYSKSAWTCRYCDWNNICEHKVKDKSKGMVSKEVDISDL